MSPFASAVLILFAPFLAFSEPDPHPPAFEVASIKPSRPPAGGAITTATRDNPGGINYTNVTLKIVIIHAYSLKAYQVSGPSWIESERYMYDIVAKAPAGTPKEQFPAMLQTLLAERFKLALHRETREQTAYALVAGKNPPKLKRSEEIAGGAPGPRGGIALAPMPGGQHVKARRVTMASFAQMLSGLMDRPVVDMTKIEGNYDIALDVDLTGLRRLAFMAGPGARGPEEGAPAPEGTPAPSIFTALQPTRA